MLTNPMLTFFIHHVLTCLHQTPTFSIARWSTHDFPTNAEVPRHSPFIKHQQRFLASHRTSTIRIIVQAKHQRFPLYTIQHSASSYILHFNTKNLYCSPSDTNVLHRTSTDAEILQQTPTFRYISPSIANILQYSTSNTDIF